MLIKIKRGDIEKYLVAVNSLNMDLVPETQYRKKRLKDKIETEHRQYVTDLDDIVTKYGTYEAPIVEQVDGTYITVGTAHREKIDERTLWKDEHGDDVDIDNINFRRVKFVGKNKETETAYIKEKKELDDMEIELDVMPITLSMLERYNEQGKKVKVNLPASADALLGVFIVESEDELKQQSKKSKKEKEQ